MLTVLPPISCHILYPPYSLGPICGLFYMGSIGQMESFNSKFVMQFFYILYLQGSLAVLHG